MNDNVKLLIEALRNGGHRQVTGQLHNVTDGVDGYCCLGVACEVYLKHNPNPDAVITHSNGTRAYFGKTTDLPEVVRKWYGFDMHDAGYEGSEQSLMNDNDSGKSFAYIAEIIESNPHGLLEE